jgi:hypothetical protein
MCPLRDCADLIDFGRQCRPRERTRIVVVRSDPKRPLVLGRDSHDRR